MCNTIHKGSRGNFTDQKYFQDISKKFHQIFDEMTHMKTFKFETGKLEQTKIRSKLTKQNTYKKKVKN